MNRPADIRLESVSKHHETPAGVVRAVDGITLEVAPGTSLAITGPSGSGKSTLLGLIGGLESPTSGRVSIGGMEISGLTERQHARLRRSELGFVFQSDNLLPFLTAVENVGLQLALHSRAADDRKRCIEVLADLGLASEVDKLPDQLSGGQRQRVAIARALIHQPAVILADEPTGSLDAESSATVIDVLLAARAQLEATLVVVTHDLRAAERLDRALSLRDGQCVDDTAGAAQPGQRRAGV